MKHVIQTIVHDILDAIKVFAFPAIFLMAFIPFIWFGGLYGLFAWFVLGIMSYMFLRIRIIPFSFVPPMIIDLFVLLPVFMWLGLFGFLADFLISLVVKIGTSRYFHILQWLEEENFCRIRWPSH